jgi:gliding motility-associated-like protein
VVNLGPDLNFCTGSSAILDAGNTGLNFSWSTGANSQTISVTTSGTYSVTVTDGLGCSSSDNVIVTVWPYPIVNLGPDDSLCIGQTMVLDAGNPGCTYIWNTGVITQTINAINSGTYLVTVTNAGGCATIGTITLYFEPNPVVNLGPDINLCSGQTATLDAGNPGMSYVWSTGANTQTISVSSSGNWSVTVSTGLGCTGTDEVNAYFKPDFTFSLGSDSTLCSVTEWMLDAGITGKNYLWSDGSTSQQILITGTGVYWVEVSDECFTHRDSISLTFLPRIFGPFVPTAFTPNGDGLNDIFTLGGVENATDFHLLIFDRWGKLIFETVNATDGWNGKTGNLDAPEGVYAIKYKAMDCLGITRYIGGAVTLAR